MSDSTPALIRSAPIERHLKHLREQLRVLEANVPGADTTSTLRRVIGELSQAIKEAGAQGVYLCCEEAAPLVKRQPATVRREARLGRIPGARKVAGEWLIPVTWVDGRAA
ncbi:MAG: hypothetical protein U0133_16155 [Gemmatimonadales bacterium]